SCRYSTLRRVGTIAGAGSTRTTSRCSPGSTPRPPPTAPHSAAPAPTIEPRTFVTRPAQSSVIPNAAIIGQAVGAGTSSDSSVGTAMLPSDDVHREEHHHPDRVHELPEQAKQLG